MAEIKTVQDAVKALGIKAKNNKDNKYGIDTIQYPSDLHMFENQHYVLFNINVRGKSKLDAKKKVLFEVSTHGKSANLSPEQLSAASTAGMQLAGTAAGAAAGKAVTSVVTRADKAVQGSGSVSLWSKAKKFTKENSGAILGAAAGAAASTAAMSFNDMLVPDKKYRISDAIALYVDGPPSVKYSMNYANKDLGTLMGMLEGGIISGLGAFNPVGEKGAAFAASAAKIPSAIGLPGDLSSAISKNAGTSLNPFREVVFESVDFRSFTFKYKFLPKSKKESEDVRAIIQRFKTHMHPQLSESKMFFIYPSEFQITYYFQNDTNSYFHKFRPCALESMDVNYGGDQFTSFSDGNPTEINISLTFKELEIITRDMIEDEEDGGY